jgi:hypothetical protein
MLKKIKIDLVVSFHLSFLSAELYAANWNITNMGIVNLRLADEMLTFLPLYNKLRL